MPHGVKEDTDALNRTAIQSKREDGEQKQQRHSISFISDLHLPLFRRHHCRPSLRFLHGGNGNPVKQVPQLYRERLAFDPPHRLHNDTDKFRVCSLPRRKRSVYSLLYLAPNFSRQLRVGQAEVLNLHRIKDSHRLDVIAQFGAIVGAPG